MALEDVETLDRMLKSAFLFSLLDLVRTLEGFPLSFIDLVHWLGAK